VKLSKGTGGGWGGGMRKGRKLANKAHFLREGNAKRKPLKKEEGGGIECEGEGEGGTHSLMNTCLYT